MTWIWQQGQMQDGAGEVVPQLSSWGVFTTAGAEAGSVLLWPRHEKRLRNSAAALGAGDAVVLPQLGEVERLLAENQIDGVGVVRVVVWRTGAQENWQVQASARKEPGLGPARPPTRLETVEWPGASPLAGLKSLARLPWDFARQTAQQRGADDALLVTGDGDVLETSVANVLCRFGREIITPAAPRYCLPGVMRGWLIDSLPQAGFRVTERSLRLEEVLAADELWLSNAVIGVQRVQSIGERRWTDWHGWEDLKDLGVPAPGWT